MVTERRPRCEQAELIKLVPLRSHVQLAGRGVGPTPQLFVWVGPDSPVGMPRFSGRGSISDTDRINELSAHNSVAWLVGDKIRYRVLVDGRALDCSRDL